MPLFDRFEAFPTWVGSPQDLAQVIQRAVEEVEARGGVPAHVRVDMFFPNRNVKQASLDDFVALRPPELVEVARVEIQILAPESAENPGGQRVALTLRSDRKSPALTLAVVHTDLTFVEGMTSRLKRDIQQIAIPRGGLVDATRNAIIFTGFASIAVPTFWFFTHAPKPAGSVIAAMISGVVGLFAAGLIFNPMANALVPQLPSLELVPVGARDRYQAFKRTAITMLGIIGTIWTIAAGMWPTVRSFLTP